MKYLALLRGINVGGRNIVPMAKLRERFEAMGFTAVLTYIASGNIIFESDKISDEIKIQLEKELPERFKLDDETIKALILTQQQLQAVFDNKPKGFGEQPETYHSDVIFLIGIDSASVMHIFKPYDGVDKIWQGNGVIYSQRLSSQRTKSRLNKVISAPEYKSMTIRNWNTTAKLLELMSAQR